MALDTRGARKTWAEWNAALGRLDRRLERAVAFLANARSEEDQDEGSESEPGLERFAGLYLDPRDVLRLAQRPAGQFSRQPDALDRLEPEPLSNALPADGRGSRLERGLMLKPFEMDVLVLALSVELDPKYEKIYGLLNDDVTRRRPTVGLALALLCGEPAVRLARRDSFRPTGPLLAFGLIELVGDEGANGGPLLSRSIRLEEGVLRFLCGDDGLPVVLESCCEPSHPETPTVADVDSGADEVNRDPTQLDVAGQALRAQGSSVRLALAGPLGVGKSRQAAGFAHLVKARLLTLHAAAWADYSQEQAAAVGRALALEVRLRTSVVHLVCTRDPGLALAILSGDRAAAELAETELEPAHRPARRFMGLGAMLDALNGLPSSVPLLLETTLDPSRAGRASRQRIRRPFLVIEVEAPPEPSRRVTWQAALRRARLDEGAAGELAAAFRLGPGPIESAAREAEARGEGIPGVWSAARIRAAEGLEDLAERIEPRAGWKDLIVRDDIRAQLEDLVRRVKCRDQVMEGWGFGSKLGYGTGASALFAGPPGTGKTLAAEVLAGRLGQLLYRVECSAVISKYIGETEKNLERIFLASRRCDAVILFDEADALFAKRSDIQDARDRYANQETAYLLQRFERHEKLTILATNFPANIDPAFPRRLSQVVHFTQPDAAERRAIWEAIWPSSLPRDHDLDLAALASRYPISGGNIKNAALGAAYRAADEHGSPPVAMRHVIAALADEYRKLGKTFEAPERPHRGVAAMA